MYLDMFSRSRMLQKDFGKVGYGGGSGMNSGSLWISR